MKLHRIAYLTLAFLCLAVFAATRSDADTSATVSWTKPTQNTDGSALTNLAGYAVYYGLSATSLSTRVNVPDATLTTYVVSSLTPGTYYFAVTAYNTATVESDLSNVSSKVITAGLAIGNDTKVYQFVGIADRIVMLPVGTVPASTACDPTQSALGYYVVPQVGVTVSWFGSVKPKVVFGQCS